MPRELVRSPRGRTHGYSVCRYYVIELERNLRSSIDRGMTPRIPNPGTQFRQLNAAAHDGPSSSRMQGERRCDCSTLDFVVQRREATVFWGSLTACIGWAQRCWQMSSRECGFSALTPDCSWAKTLAAPFEPERLSACCALLLYTVLFHGLIHPYR